MKYLAVEAHIVKRMDEHEIRKYYSGLHSMRFLLCMTDSEFKKAKQRAENVLGGWRR